MQPASSAPSTGRRIFLVLAALALLGIGLATVQSLEKGALPGLDSKKAGGEKSCDEKCQAEKEKWYACVERHGEAYCKAQWSAAKAKSKK